MFQIIFINTNVLSGAYFRSFSLQQLIKITLKMQEQPQKPKGKRQGPKYETLVKRLDSNFKNKIYQLNEFKSAYYLTSQYRIQSKDVWNIKAIKSNIASDIDQYTQRLLQDFIPLTYLLSKKQDQKKVVNQELSKISIKQYFCINICLNIFYLINQYRNTCEENLNSEQEISDLLSYLFKAIQSSLVKWIAYFQKSFPQSTQSQSVIKSQAVRMKKSIQSIDRRQNEEHDFLMLHQITFSGDFQNYLMQIMNKLFSQEIEIESQIKAMFFIIFSDEQYAEDSDLQDLIRENNNKFSKQIRKIRNLKQYFSTFEQMEKIIFGQSSNGQADEKQQRKSQTLRILTKFIENILNLIQNYEQSTLKRYYPYKNTDNVLVYPNQQINRKLAQNMGKLKMKLAGQEGDSQLKNIKEQLLKQQMFNITQKRIYQQSDPIVYIVNKSRAYTRIMFKKCWQYLIRLMRMVIQAGQIQTKKGKININLITFNVLDLFRARQSVTVQKYEKIMKKVYKLQQRRNLYDLSKRQKIFKILRLKDKTESVSKAVFLNFVYKNQVCEAQINTKENSSRTLYQMSHLLYELTRGQYGIISEMLNIISSKYDVKSHQFNLLLNKQQINQKQKNYQLLDAQVEAKFQNYENSVEKIIQRPYWTNLFINDNLPQAKNNKERLECIINPNNREVFQTITLKDKNFVSILVFDNQENDVKQKKYYLSQVQGFLCIQRLVLNHFKKDKTESLMKDLSFINHFACFQLKQLNLSNNNLTNFELFHQPNKFKSLVTLDLSSNKFEKTIDYDSGCFVRLKLLNLSFNRIVKINIFRTRDFSQDQKVQKTILFDGEKNKMRYSLNDSSISVETNNKAIVIYFYSIFQKIDFNIIINEDQQLVDNEDKFYQDDNPSQDKLNQDNKLNQENVQNYQYSNPFQYVSNKKNQFRRRKFSHKIKQIAINHAFDTEEYFSQLHYQMQKIMGIINTDFEDKIGNIPKQTQPNLNGSCCFRIGNSCIVITVAHAVIFDEEHKEWNNPSKHQKIKNKILKRTKYFSNKQLKKKKEKKIPLQFQQIWFPNSYIKDKNERQDICILFLKKVSPQNLCSKQIFKILFRQNKQITYNFLLKGYIFGFDMSNTNQLAKLLKSFANIFYDNISNQGLQMDNARGFFQSSGSPVIFVKYNSPKNWNYDIIGVKTADKDNTKSCGSLFKQQIMKILKHTYYSFTPNHTTIDSYFRSQEDFKKMVAQQITIEKICQDSKNIIHFISKLFKIFIYFLEKYLFLDSNDFDVTQDDILKIIFVTNRQTNSEGDYDVDIKNIQLKSIFESTIINQDVIDNLQVNFAQVVIRILQQIQNNYLKNEKETAFLINSFINFINKIKEKQKYSLKNILHVIIWSINTKNFDQIQKYLTNFSANDQLKDNDFYNIKKILIRSNVFQRIQCFLNQILLSKFQYPDNPNQISDSKQQMDPNFSRRRCFQRTNTLNKQMCKQINNEYMKQLNYYVDNSVIKDKQKQGLDVTSNFILMRKKIVIIETLKQYYPQIQNLKIEDLHEKYKDISIERNYDHNLFHYEKQYLLDHAYSLINQNIKKMIKSKIDKDNLVDKTMYDAIQNTYLQCQKEQFQRMCLLYQQSFQRTWQSKMKQNAQQIDNCQNLEQSQIQEANIQREIQLLDIKNVNPSSPQPANKLSNLSLKQNNYKDHIGAILIYDLLSGDNKQQNGYLCGTGTLIDKNIVVTAAHILEPYIQDNFSKERLKFCLYKDNQFNDDDIKKVANIIEIQFLPKQDVAILVLDRQMIKQSQFRLVSHNKNAGSSNFEGKNFFCQILGFINSNKTYKLKKSEGFIFIKDIYNHQIKYSLQTDHGQSGGIIIFFPTGRFKEPYILGIHTHGYTHHPQFVGSNTELYLQEKYNYGQIILYEELYNCNKVTFSIKAYKTQQKLSINTVQENSYLFSESIQQIKKWQLTKNFLKHVYEKISQQSSVIRQGYLTVSKCLQLGLVFNKINPENLFSFKNRGQLHPFFDISIEFRNPYQQSLNGSIAKRSYQNAINKYYINLEALNIVEPYLQYLLEMKRHTYKESLQTYQIFQKRLTEDIQLLLKQINHQPVQNNCKMFKEKIQKMRQIGGQYSLQNVSVRIFRQFFSQNLKNIELNHHRKQDQKRLAFVLDKFSLINQDQSEQKKGNKIETLTFNKIEQKFFSQQLLFVKYLKNHQNQRDFIQLGHQYLLFKIACQSVYQLYHFCIKNHILRKQQFSSRIFKKYQLNKSNFDYSGKNRYLNNSLENQVFNNITLRANAIFEIEKISVCQKKKTNLIKHVLNWQNSSEKWQKKIKEIIKPPSKHWSERLQINTIGKILNSYNYLLCHSKEHILNTGAIVIEQLSFHKFLFAKKSIWRFYHVEYK